MPIGGKSTEGGTLRKVLLLAALAMAVTMVFAPMAVAQDVDCPQLSEAEEQAVFAADPSDPNGLDENENGVPCEDDMTDDGSFTLPTEETTMMEPTSVEPTTVEPTTASPTASPIASPTASPTASAAPLPSTGGPVSVLALGSLALLVGSGIMAFGIMRRS